MRQPRERARARVTQDSRKETKSCGMIFAFFVTYSHIVTPFITQKIYSYTWKEEMSLRFSKLFTQKTAYY